MSEVHPITFRLKVFNAWRRGNNAPQPDPKTVGEDIDSICDIAKRLERERDEAREALENYKAQSIHSCHDQCQQPMCVLGRELERERALADRLAKALLSFCSSGMVWPNTDTPEKAIAAWKEARSE